MLKKVFLILTCFLIYSFSTPNVKIAVLKYRGGGDWYANPSALKNLVQFSNDHMGTNMNTDYATVEASSTDIFNYPFVHMTGHGNVVFDSKEAENIRTYLLSGGFIHIDDNYGMDKFIRPELKKIFPDRDLVELPASHPIFNKPFKLGGLPKIHEHDKKPPQAFALYDANRIMLIYTFESDLGDGWEDPEVHKDPEEKRTQALQMGCNILNYAFNGQP